MAVRRQAAAAVAASNHKFAACGVRISAGGRPHRQWVRHKAVKQLCFTVKRGCARVPGRAADCQKSIKTSPSVDMRRRRRQLKGSAFRFRPGAGPWCVQAKIPERLTAYRWCNPNRKENLYGTG